MTDPPAVGRIVTEIRDDHILTMAIDRPEATVDASLATEAKPRMAQARSHGLTVSLLPAWYDVDVHEDLLRLRADVRAAPDEVAANTRAFLLDAALEP